MTITEDLFRSEEDLLAKGQCEHLGEWFSFDYQYILDNVSQRFPGSCFLDSGDGILFGVAPSKFLWRILAAWLSWTREISDCQASCSGDHPKKPHYSCARWRVRRGAYNRLLLLLLFLSRGQNNNESVVLVSSSASFPAPSHTEIAGHDEAATYGTTFTLRRGITSCLGRIC